jgi:mannose-6-phosphate isomerase-like protein (cupin superfamily)
LDADATDIIKLRTLKRPVREGDIVPIPFSAEHQLTRSSEQMVPLILEEAEPEGDIRVTERTEIN